MSKKHTKNKKGLNRQSRAVAAEKPVPSQPSVIHGIRPSHGKSSTATWAWLMISVAGLVTFWAGLASGFVGDDSGQVIGNPVIQSLRNLPLLFRGSTFYNGQGLTPLAGAYYRPLMMVMYSLIYSIFGLNPFWFHLIQLVLYVLGAILLFNFLRYMLDERLSLIVALIFLVHPFNSQAVYAIASLQEPLFFDFGMLALVLLMRLKNTKELILAVVCLFLSLLSKETGVLFVGVATLYLYLFNRKWTAPFLLALTAPLALYLMFRVNAVGWLRNPHLGPIDEVGLGQRLLTAPSIMMFYLTGFIFPLHLATYFYWTYPSFTWAHVALHAAFDVAISALIAGTLVLVHKQSSGVYFRAAVFFALWFAVGLFINLQIFPLGATANDVWFLFPMAGLLSFIGIAIQALWPRELVWSRWAYAAIACLLLLLAIRSAAWASAWRNEASLDYSNIAVSKQNYAAEVGIAHDLINRHNYQSAEVHARRAVALYPIGETYDVLGDAEADLGQYRQASETFHKAIKLSGSSYIYDDAAALFTAGTDYVGGESFIDDALTLYPQDAKLWMYLAILEYRQGNQSAARVDISRAYSYSNEPQVAAIYRAIMR
jgi:tetratricopeptide (TPR) repeat protein